MSARRNIDMVGMVNKLKEQCGGECTTEYKRLDETENFSAVLAGVVDYGEVESTWQGETKKRNEIGFLWVVYDHLEDSHHLLSQKFGLSFHEKSSLSKTLKTWGKDHKDFTDLIEQEALISIVNNKNELSGKTYTNITIVRPASERKKFKRPEKPLRLWGWLKDIPSDYEDTLVQFAEEKKDDKALPF